jgi:hypothetical protein
MAKSGISRFALGLAVLTAVALFLLWRTGSSSQAKGKGEQSIADTARAIAPPAPKGSRPAPDASVTTGTSAPSPSIPVADARPSSPPAQYTEASLMQRLRSARAAKQHALAIHLAREGNKRFPDSAFAPERHSILIHSLADNEQRIDARGEAESMVNRYPDSDWVREIERFTGAHRHRNVRLTDAGELEYY